MQFEEEQAEKKKRIQLGVFAPEIFVHLLVWGTEVVDVGFSEGGTRELNVSPGSVRRDLEALPLEERVRLHAPVLVR